MNTKDNKKVMPINNMGDLDTSLCELPDLENLKRKKNFQVLKEINGLDAFYKMRHIANQPERFLELSYTLNDYKNKNGFYIHEDNNRRYFCGACKSIDESRRKEYGYETSCPECGSPLINLRVSGTIEQAFFYNVDKNTIQSITFDMQISTDRTSLDIKEKIEDVIIFKDKSIEFPDTFYKYNYETLLDAVYKKRKEDFLRKNPIVQQYQGFLNKLNHNVKLGIFLIFNDYIDLDGWIKEEKYLLFAFEHIYYNIDSAIDELKGFSNPYSPKNHIFFINNDYYYVEDFKALFHKRIQNSDFLFNQISKFFEDNYNINKDIEENLNEISKSLNKIKDYSENGTFDKILLVLKDIDFSLYSLLNILEDEFEDYGEKITSNYNEFLDIVLKFISEHKYYNISLNPIRYSYYNRNNRDMFFIIKTRTQILSDMGIKVNNETLSTRFFNILINKRDMKAKYNLPEVKELVFHTLIEKDPLKAYEFISDRRQLNKEQLEFVYKNNIISK